MKTSITSGHLKKFTVVTLFLLIAHIAKSSSPDTIFITEPSVVRVCAENHFTATFSDTGTFGISVNILVIDATNDDTIAAVCPPGGSGINAVQMQIDSASANCTFTYMGNNKWSISKPTAGNASIYYSLFVDCSLLNDPVLQAAILAQGESNGNTFLIQTWTDTLTSILIPLFDGTPHDSIVSTNLSYPFLTRLNTDNEKANYKGTRDSLYLYFAYRNAGDDTANILINFMDSLNCGSYSLIGNPGYAIDNDTIGKSSLTYSGFTAGSDTVASIPPNYFLIIREHVVITGCLPCNNDTAALTWRCNTTAAGTCATCQQYYYTAFNIDPLGGRNVKYSRVSPGNANATYDLTCNGNTMNWSVKIENTGQFGISEIPVSLDYYLQGNNALTLIDTSTVRIIKSDPSIILTDSSGTIPFTFPSNCVACFDTFPASVLPECAAQMPYRFKTFKFSVHDLLPAKGAIPAQHVRLNFSTYRCATSDDSLLNAEKFFNNWTIHISPIDECGDTLTSQNISDSNVIQSTLNAISGELKHIQGIDQVLDLSTTVTNLSIPPGPGTGVRYGDKAQIAVDLDGITADPFEYDHFGCTSPTQPFSCNLRGFIKARVFCESGLLVADTNVFLNYNLDTLRPVLAYADTSNPFACDSGSYTYIFDLSQDTMAYEILNFGQFIFTLGSCCPAADHSADYKIAFYLLADPAGNCYSSILGSVYDYNKLDTAALAWLPLSSVQNVCEIACPGCKAVGAVAYRYTIDRITYGLADSDNDRIADTTLAVADSSYAFFGKLNVKSSMSKDRLLDKLTLKMQDGDATDSVPGYTYSQMLLHNARLKYLQIQRTFPLMDSLMDIQIERFVLYIDKADTTQADTCYDCAAYGAPPYNFSTMTVLSVNTAQLGSYITTPALNNRVFTFRDSLLEYPSQLDSIIHESSDTNFQFHGYNTDQRFRLSVIYSICGNFEAPFPSSPIKRESNITNFAWFSGSAHPSSSGPEKPNDTTGLHSYGWTLDTLLFPNYTLINQHFADTFLFWCTTNSGRHFFFSNEQTIKPEMTLNPGDCGRYLSVPAVSTIGRGSVNDIFPFEFRRPDMAPVSYDLKLPLHHYFKNPALVRTYSNYLNHVAYTLDDEVITGTSGITFPPNTDTCHITLSQLPQAICFNDTSDNVLSASDQKSWYELIFQVGDSVCEASIDSLVTKITFTDDDSLACENSNNHFCATDTVIKNSKVPPQVINPNLIFTSSPNLVHATQPQVCWEVTITNVAGTNVTAAYNVFIAVPNDPFLHNWTWAGNNLTVNTPYIIVPVLNPPNTVSDTLCATYHPCMTNDTVHQVTVNWGWNCDSVFVVPDSACGNYSDTLLMEHNPAGLFTQFPMTDSITLCQPFQITAWFSGTGLGSMFPFMAYVDSLQQGLSVISCIATVGNIVDTLTTSDSLNWYFSPGTEVMGEDTMYVTLTLYPDCGFFIFGDTLPSFTLYSIKYCGDTIISPVAFGLPVQSISNPSACVNCTCASLTNIHIADSSFASQYGTGISNTPVLIMGRFYVDTNFTFSNCNVLTLAGAQIIVMAPCSLTLDSATDISACDTMWRGIYLEDETYFYEKNGSSIRDADTGVFVNNGCVFQVLNSSITECVNGIFVPPYTSPLHTITGKVVGSHFGMSAPFKPDFAGQTAHGSIPKAGIEIYNLILALGDTSNSINEFFNMNSGIAAHNSDLSIKRTKFYNITYDTVYKELYRGSAIICDQVNNSYYYTPKLKVLPEVLSYNTVDSCFRGIYAYGASLDVNYVHLLNVYQGIRCENALFWSGNMVTHCTITATFNGLFFVYNPWAQYINASFNNITINGGTGGAQKQSNSAIFMAETNFGTVRYMTSNDSINITSTSFGIYAGYLNQAKIKFNDIKINGNGTGIASNGNYLTSVSCNTIKGTYDTVAVQNSIGILTGNSSINTSIYCNTLDSTFRGFYFGGWCPGTMFKGNDMFTHFNGLYLNTGSGNFPTIMGIQPHHGNRWDGPFKSLGAINLALNIFVPFSRFDINSTLGSVYNPIVNPSTWFHSDTSSFTFYCNNSFACSAPPPALTDSALNAMIVNGTFESEDFPDEARAIAEEYLYRELSDDSALWVEDSTYIEFMLENQTDNTGYLYDAGEYLRAAYQFDTVFIGLIDSTNSLIEMYTDSMIMYEGMSSTENDYTALVLYYWGIINFLNQTIENITFLREASLVDDLENALLNNGYVVSGELPESNSAYINDIEIEYIDSSGQRNVILDNYSLILSIAQQCPYVGGPAVERARTFIALINDSIEYDDETVCLLSGVFRTSISTPEKLKEENKIIVKPNPANNKIEIALIGEFEDGICKIEMSNLLGESVLNVEMNCKEKGKWIDISNLLQGVYSIKINANNLIQLNSKLVIVR